MRALKAKPKPQLEHDIQSQILACLGEEQFEIRTDKNGRSRKCSLNVWTAPGQLWTRINSGMFRTLWGEARMRSGCPGINDIIGCVDGWWVGLECKRPREKQNPAQLRFQEWIEEAGGEYHVVTSIAEAKAIVCGVRGSARRGEQDEP